MKALIVSIIVLLAGSVQAQDQSVRDAILNYQKTGTLQITRMGNQTYGRIGNQNLQYNKIGNMGFGSLGKQNFNTSKIGNTTFINSGNKTVICNKIGNSVFCN